MKMEPLFQVASIACLVVVMLVQTFHYAPTGRSIYLATSVLALAASVAGLLLTHAAGL